LAATEEAAVPLPLKKPLLAAVAVPTIVLFPNPSPDPVHDGLRRVETPRPPDSPAEEVAAKPTVITWV